jgi:hypothetical protein
LKKDKNHKNHLRKCTSLEIKNEKSDDQRKVMKLYPISRKEEEK